MVFPVLIPFVAAALIANQTFQNATSPAANAASKNSEKPSNSQGNSPSSKANPITSPEKQEAKTKQKQFSEQFKQLQTKSSGLESKTLKTIAMDKRLMKEKKLLKETMKIKKTPQKPSNDGPFSENQADLNKTYQPSVMMFDHPFNYNTADDDIRWYEEISSSEFSEEFGNSNSVDVVIDGDARND